MVVERSIVPITALLLHCYLNEVMLKHIVIWVTVTLIYIFNKHSTNICSFNNLTLST